MLRGALGGMLSRGRPQKVETGPMDELVARLNIEHYRKLLASETDYGKKKLFEKLLADEGAKLAAAKDKNRQSV